MNYAVTLQSLAVSLVALGCQVEETVVHHNTTTDSTSTTTTTSTSSTSSTSTTSPTGCTEHLDCANDEICIDGTCNLAWGRAYAIGGVAADIAGTDPSTGLAWDSFGGAPDPYVVWYENGTPVMTTAAASNTFTPDFGTSVSTHTLGATQPVVSVYMWDEDNDADDYILGVDGTPEQWLAVIRYYGGVLQVDNGAGTFMVILVQPVTW